MYGFGMFDMRVACLLVVVCMWDACAVGESEEERPMSQQ